MATISYPAEELIPVIAQQIAEYTTDCTPYRGVRTDCARAQLTKCHEIMLMTEVAIAKSGNVTLDKDDCLLLGLI